MKDWLARCAVFWNIFAGLKSELHCFKDSMTRQMDTFMFFWWHFPETTECPELDGTFADPQRVTGYLNCSGGISTKMNCSKGLVWRDDKKACDKSGKIFIETECHRLPQRWTRPHMILIFTRGDFLLHVRIKYHIYSVKRPTSNKSPPWKFKITTVHTQIKYMLYHWLTLIKRRP